jgi:type IV fimbrial biogenesis protein FimT
MKFCRGFTLLELMAAIAVLAILATVGIPSFQTLIQNNRVTTQTNELVTALTFARAEAVKRGRSVQVDVVAADPGWTATVAIAGPGGATLRRFDREGSGVVIDGDVSVVFEATGAASAVQSIFLQPGPSCTGDKRRQVQVGLSGQINTSRLDCT